MLLLTANSKPKSKFCLENLCIFKTERSRCVSFTHPQYRSGSYFGSHRILGHITSRLPHQLTTKPRFYCVPTVFLYVFVEFVELTWHIRHDPKCENRWNFFFNPIFCHELHEILTNGFSHCNRGFLKLQMLFYDFGS